MIILGEKNNINCDGWQIILSYFINVVREIKFYKYDIFQGEHLAVLLSRYVDEFFQKLFHVYKYF